MSSADLSATRARNRGVRDVVVAMERLLNSRVHLDGSDEPPQLSLSYADEKALRQVLAHFGGERMAEPSDDRAAVQPNAEHPAARRQDQTTALLDELPADLWDVTVVAHGKWAEVTLDLATRRTIASRVANAATSRRAADYRL